MQQVKELESRLWEAADKLRANSRLTAGEYSMPVLGLIFLRQATNRFYQVKEQIEATLPSRGGVKRQLTADDFRGKAALFLPEEARYDYLVDRPGDADIGKALVEAMTAVEAQSKMLEGALPKEYTRFDPRLLRDLLRIFNDDILRRAGGDLFGRIYEYFLNKFAMTGAQEGGEFFTPPSLVRLIVNVIEPQRGKVLDCAVGSGGMFVQTGYFLERQGRTPGHAVVFYGQEKSDLTIRLARMNLAVHGLEGTIYEGNTFYDTLPDLIGGCDFVMANPPFNVDMVDPDRIKSDPRLPWKIPGTSQKTGAVSNANYLWIQYFYSYLNDAGRAGFVMASSATDAGYGEKRIREELIKTGHVDAVVAIGTNFFYTRSLPCTLWFFDKAKPAERQETVLMIDARSIYRVVTRKIRDFSDEQLQNLTAIVWLHRGEEARFVELVGGYLARSYRLARAAAGPLKYLAAVLGQMSGQLCNFARKLGAEPPPEGANGYSAEEIETFQRLAAEQRAAVHTFYLESSRARRKAFYSSDWGLDDAARYDNAAQHALHERLESLVEQLRSVQPSLHAAYKLVEQALDYAEKTLGARRHPHWDSAAMRDLKERYDEQRERAVETIRGSHYYLAQAGWLQSRFPDAVFVPVPGLCAAVTRAEIATHDGSLTPGRYVGVGAAEMEDDEEFEERMREIHAELSSLNEEAVQLAEQIRSNFEELAL